jgi:hypothetical protein
MAKPRSSSYPSTAEKVLLQPWFLPQRITFAIHGMVPPGFWNKMRNFFDDYGCMICGGDSAYHSNGMCQRCYRKVRAKLLKSIKRHLKPEPERSLALELVRQVKLARKLLGRFAGRRQTSGQGRAVNLLRQNNPVYEALCARPR